MKVKILGVRVFDFVGKEGNRVRGNTLWGCTAPSHDDVFGEETLVVKVPMKKLDDILKDDEPNSLVGRYMCIDYNSQGYIQDAYMIK